MEVLLRAGPAPAGAISLGARAGGGAGGVWRFEESLRWQGPGVQADVLAERDPREARAADHLTGTLQWRRGGWKVLAGDLRLRAPALVFAARGPGAEASWRASPAPPGISPWASPAEFGAVRGVGLVTGGRHATAAVAAGSTALDLRGGAAELSRSGDHAAGADVRRDAGREDALFASLWLSGRRLAAGAALFTARYRPGFDSGSGEPRDGTRAGLSLCRRFGAGNAWLSTAAGTGGWDAGGGLRFDEERFAMTAAFRASGGAGPRGARTPRAAAGGSAGVEAAQTISWTPRPAWTVRVEGSARIPVGGEPVRSFAAQSIWGRAASGSEWQLGLSARGVSRRITLECARAVPAGAVMSLAAARDADGGTVLGAGLRSAPGALFWSMECHAASPEGSGGAGIFAVPRGGAVAGTQLGWERGALRLRAGAAWRSKKDGTRGSAYTFAFERRWGSSADALL